VWRDRSLILHLDKALTYSSLRVSQFLAGKGISALDHQPYSPDLATKLESVLKGNRLFDIEDIKSSVKKDMLNILVQDFQHCFEQWPKC
jgi:hypothetical protein